MFFTPTVDFLDDPPALPGADTVTAPPAPTHDGSLSIGSLKGRPQ
jgi:putative iron-dependent peroxidase